MFSHTCTSSKVLGLKQAVLTMLCSPHVLFDCKLKLACCLHEPEVEKDTLRSEVWSAGKRCTSGLGVRYFITQALETFFKKIHLHIFSKFTDHYYKSLNVVGVKMWPQKHLVILISRASEPEHCG